MRAEADRKMAAATRLEADAGDRKSTLHEHVQRRDEVLAEADEIDPDVSTDEDTGTDGATDGAVRGSTGEHQR
jgi:hypothetical protein